MAPRGIRSDPEVMMGKPVVEGTRVTVESMLEELGAGRTIEELLEAHPRLTREGVLADEGVDAAMVARLRSDGHDVVYVAEVSPGIIDDAVLELANADERVLTTEDKDFGEHGSEMPGAFTVLSSGLVRIRPPL
jgi:uncharacterized protein (DUF433 family)